MSIENMKNFITMLFKAPTLFIASVFKWSSKIDGHKMFIVGVMQEVFVLLLLLAYATSADSNVLGIGVLACALLLSLFMNYYFAGSPRTKEDFMYCVFGKTNGTKYVVNTAEKAIDEQYKDTTVQQFSQVQQYQQEQTGIYVNPVSEPSVSLGDLAEEETISSEEVSKISSVININDSKKVTEDKVKPEVNSEQNDSPFHNVFEELLADAVEENVSESKGAPLDMSAIISEEKAEKIVAEPICDTESKVIGEISEKPVKEDVEIMNDEELNNRLQRDIIRDSADFVEVDKYLKDNGIGLGDLTDGIGDDEEI